MILDTLENSILYEAIHPRFKQAFEFLCNENLEKLNFGKIILDGDNLFVSVVEIQGKTEAESRMETHQNYIDIQVPIGNTEVMGWKSLKELKDVLVPYNEEKDITFYADKASNLILVQPYCFAVFFPEDGHQPGIASGTYKKVIVKVRV